MGKLIYSKEIKIQACKEYETGEVSFNDIAKVIGVSKKTVRQWFLMYKEHGSSVFETSNKRKRYCREFKSKVVKEYISCEYSQLNLAAKYNISAWSIGDWVKRWYNSMELEDCSSKREVYAMKSRETTFEERIEIVKWIIENDMDYKGASEKYSVKYATSYQWTKTYIKQGPESLEYKKRGPKAKSEINKNDLSEIDKLKLELDRERALRKRREFEIEVLKKKEELEKELRFRK